MKFVKLSILLVTTFWFCTYCDTAFAQERLIAVVMANSQPRYQEVHSAFVENSGSFCSTDCKLYVQTPNADMMSLRNAVRKAVALEADMIVTYGPLSTLAAQAETPLVPTLFADVYDPVGLGIVSADSLTGTMTTGVRGDGPIQGLLKYFNDTVDLQKLGVLYDIHSPEALLQKSVLEESGKRRGIEVVVVGVQKKSDHHSFLKRFPDDIEGVFVASSDHHESQLTVVLNQASARKIPIITQRAKAAELGAFMVLESSAVEQGEKLAEMAGQVFSGVKIDNIPMQKPHQVAFVVNLKTAKQFGIVVPIQTLSVASRIVR